MKKLFSIILLFMYSCSDVRKENEHSHDSVKTDTLEMIRGFIYGLWSKDSGNVLSNVGLYFKTDGTVDFAPSDVTGDWELTGKDSIKIAYAHFDQVFNAKYKINSILQDRLVLSDSDGTYTWRKVPFGMNNEGVVLQGFSGQLTTGETKTYSFDLPAAKKTSLKISSTCKEVMFRVFEDEKEITSGPVHAWSSILIRSGKYTAKVEFVQDGTKKQICDFDLKVIGY